MIPILKFKIPILKFKFPILKFKIPTLKFKFPVLKFKIPILKIKRVRRLLAHGRVNGKLAQIYFLPKNQNSPRILVFCEKNPTLNHFLCSIIIFN